MSEEDSLAAAPPLTAILRKGVWGGFPFLLRGVLPAGEGAPVESRPWQGLAVVVGTWCPAPSPLWGSHWVPAASVCSCVGSSMQARLGCWWVGQWCALGLAGPCSAIYYLGGLRRISESA